MSDKDDKWAPSALSPQKKKMCGLQTTFGSQQVIGVDQEKWAGIKKFVGSGKPANGNYV